MSELQLAKDCTQICRAISMMDSHIGFDLSICLSIYLSIDGSIYFLFVYLSIHPSIYLCTSLSLSSLSLSLSLCPSLSVSICLSVYPSFLSLRCRPVEVFIEDPCPLGLPDVLTDARVGDSCTPSPPCLFRRIGGAPQVDDGNLASLHTPKHTETQQELW